VVDKYPSGTTTMAKQKGINPLSGTIDNITYFQTVDGEYHARKKSKLTGEQMATMPAFQAMRDHTREYARTGKAIKLIRSGIKTLLLNTADRKAAQRLRALLYESLKLDTTSLRGERTVQDGDLSLLLNFDFNVTALLDTVIAAPFTTTIDRVTGTVDLVVPAFNPTILLTAPPQATHFRLKLGAAAVDFATEETEGETVESAFLPLTNVATAPLTLTANVSANTTKHILALVGIRFYNELNAAKYPIYSHDALAIVNLDQ
jgi:hypothetical protein